MANTRAKFRHYIGKYFFDFLMALRSLSRRTILIIIFAVKMDLARKFEMKRNFLEFHPNQI